MSISPEDWVVVMLTVRMIFIQALIGRLLSVLLCSLPHQMILMQHLSESINRWHYSIIKCGGSLQICTKVMGRDPNNGFF